MSKNKDYVRREILKTGFPLELEVFSILNSPPVPWITTAQDYYYDEDEKKSRYIDLAAMEMPNFDEEGKLKNPIEPLRLNWNLSIECKKSSRNWVFFPVDDYYVDTSGNGLNIKPLSWGGGFGHYDPFKHKIASIYTVISSGKDEIFEAVMQLVKHVAYSKNAVWDRIKFDADFKYSMGFWFPIVVLDGKMWNVFTKEGRITEISESKHTILKVKYGSIDGTHESFAIDIVQKSYFSELMDIIHKVMKIYEEYTLKEKKNIMEMLDEEFEERQRDYPENDD